MTCHVSGGGCRVCPGVWLAGLVLLGMLIQSVFFSAPPSPTPAQTDPAPAAIQ